MSGEVSAEILTTHLLDLASKGKRIDGRGIDEYRPIRIEPGFAANADGSAFVH
ncbi:hypothetical protein B1B_03151, partial [mine drainage metagenome]